MENSKKMESGLFHLRNAAGYKTIRILLAHSLMFKQLTLTFDFSKINPSVTL